jgi:hypothetical protein
LPQRGQQRVEDRHMARVPGLGRSGEGALHGDQTTLEVHAGPEQARQLARAQAREHGGGVVGVEILALGPGAGAGG